MGRSRRGSSQPTTFEFDLASHQAKGIPDTTMNSIEANEVERLSNMASLKRGSRNAAHTLAKPADRIRDTPGRSKISSRGIATIKTGLRRNPRCRRSSFITRISIPDQSRQLKLLKNPARTGADQKLAELLCRQRCFRILRS